jgi:hypothetical protein
MRTEFTPAVACVVTLAGISRYITFQEQCKRIVTLLCRSSAKALLHYFAGTVQRHCYIALQEQCKGIVTFCCIYFISIVVSDTI